MELSRGAFFALLAAVALARLAELRHSDRNQRRLAEEGAVLSPEPGYRWMVMLHAGWIAGSAVEVLWLHRPFQPWLGWPALFLFLSANAVRYWVIATLGEHWNTRIVDSTRLGVVAAGPYRWVRHPNYSAVFLEVATLPLVHGAWWTSLAISVLHIFVIRRRIRTEESVLMANEAYRRLMGTKPRFFPRRRR